ncbi:cbb3-type cytochrome oxidase assembly protein CcoS [Luteimonas sp. RIT-PG2_3]
MRILLLMIPISIVLLGVAIWAFAWAVRRGQFDDLDTPPLDILVDDDAPPSRDGRDGRHDADPARHAGKAPRHKDPRHDAD